MIFDEEFRFLHTLSCSVSALTGLKRCGSCSIREQPTNKGTKETEKFKEMDVHCHPHPSYHHHHYSCLCYQTMDTETWWCLEFSSPCPASEAFVYNSLTYTYMYQPIKKHPSIVTNKMMYSFDWINERT